MHPRLLLSVLLASGLPALPARAADPVLFETHILPILETRCLKCHGHEKTRGGLDVRRRFTLIRGGDGGTVFDAPTAVDAPVDGAGRGFGELCTDKGDCLSNICIFSGVSGVCSVLCAEGTCTGENCKSQGASGRDCERSKTDQSVS